MLNEVSPVNKPAYQIFFSTPGGPSKPGGRDQSKQEDSEVHAALVRNAEGGIQLKGEVTLNTLEAGEGQFLPMDYGPFVIHLTNNRFKEERT